VSDNQTPDGDVFNKLPDGAREVSPLAVMLFATAIPVSLAALAAVRNSTAALVFAVLAMVVVAGATLGFMVRITSDADAEAHDGREGSSE
jgi:ABC-type Na+ efflux pump permease subunit